jgi:hypothetical protein
MALRDFGSKREIEQQEKATDGRWPFPLGTDCALV